MKNPFLIILCLFSTVQLFAQKTNFSGTWQLDTVKTVFGPAKKNIIPETIKVEQQSNKLALTRISLDEASKEQAPITETLFFNGMPFQRKSGNSTITTTLKWPDDSGFTLTRSGNLNATEDWSLEDDGKTLVIDRAVEQTSNGFKYTIKCYYDKQ